MRRPLVIGIVVGIHLIVGLIVLMPGCATPEAVDTDAVVDVRPVRMPPARSQMPIVRRPVSPDLPFVAPESSVVSSGEEHVIKSGETLSRIAAKYGVRTATLASLNGIRNKNLIRAGQVLKVPSGSRSGSGSSSVNVVRRVPVSGDTYVVKSGDCLSAIAAAHSVKLADLRSANGASGDLIFVGQKLVIPGGRRSTTSPVRPVQDVVPPVERIAPQAPELRIPPVERIPDAPTIKKQPEEAPKAPDSMHYVPHVVEDGQDLYTIAMMYNVRVQQIRKANSIPADGSVSVGQRLRIPVAIGE